MLLATIALFALAAVLGLALASRIVKNSPTSKPVAVAHGLVGATGLGLLVVYVMQQPNRMLTWAIALLVVAALGGAVLFVNDLRKKPGPIGLIAIHALVAIIAVFLVALAALS